MSPPKKQKIEAVSDDKRPGPVPKPYLEKAGSSQARDAAFIAKNFDRNAIYHASHSTIGKGQGENRKVNQNIAYVMREMKYDPKLASEIKKFIIRRKKNKGTYLLFIICKYMYLFINM